jgi:hypothetical protein
LGLGKVRSDTRCHTVSASSCSFGNSRSLSRLSWWSYLDHANDQLRIHVRSLSTLKVICWRLAACSSVCAREVNFAWEYCATYLGGYGSDTRLTAAQTSPGREACKRAAVRMSFPVIDHGCWPVETPLHSIGQSPKHRFPALQHPTGRGSGPASPAAGSGAKRVHFATC